jgi:tRNA-2-methylthio-N6-dimethylallyladenosine synthase
VSKTFYIETFGCQMNAHDSEKVIGTLEHEGYTQVANEDEVPSGTRPSKRSSIA